MKLPGLVFVTSALLGSNNSVLGFVGRQHQTQTRSGNSIKSLQNDVPPDLSDEEGDELIQRMTKSFFGSNPPANPFETTRPSKLDIYNESDLQTLWNVHERNQQVFTAEPKAVDESSVLSIHDLIMQSLGDGDTCTAAASTPLLLPLQVDWLDASAKQRIAKVRAIASDVDGTLLTSRMTLHPRTKQAIQRSLAAAASPLEPLQWFFPATGKSRKGALDSLGPEIGALLSKTPGVFLQGLYCVDDKGRVVFERKLTAGAVEQVERLVAELQLSIVAYDGDDLYTTQLTESVLELHERYGEPLPSLLPRAVADHAPGVHKILLMDRDTEKLKNEVRPKLEALAAANGACVTQAIPTMLEVLPSGCSKALGVRKLCEALGIDMETQLLALGDAENDVMMLQQASIGVAMGNASPIAKEAADFVMEETNDDGGAGAAMEVFCFRQML
jgi:Cof subfamily protein (haloacid dehalogenase superfamily)